MSEITDRPTSPATLAPLEPTSRDLPSASPPANAADEFPGEVEMSLVDHLEELRRRVLRSLLAVVAGALSAASRDERRICRRSLARSSGLVRYEAAAPARAELRSDGKWWVRGVRLQQKCNKEYVD